MSLSVARLRLSIVDIVDILDVQSARTVAGLFVKVLSPQPPQLQTNALSRRKVDKPISANWVENHPVEINRESPVRVGGMQSHCA